MIKEIAWDVFKNTGDINTFLEYKQIENLEKVVLVENESYRKMVDELLINLEEYLIKIKDKN